jgi:hypothetical protein
VPFWQLEEGVMVGITVNVAIVGIEAACVKELVI